MLPPAWRPEPLPAVPGAPCSVPRAGAQSKLTGIAAEEHSAGQAGPRGAGAPAAQRRRAASASCRAPSPARAEPEARRPGGSSEGQRRLPRGGGLETAGGRRMPGGGANLGTTSPAAGEAAASAPRPPALRRPPPPSGAPAAPAGPLRAAAAAPRLNGAQANARSAGGALQRRAGSVPPVGATGASARTSATASASVRGAQRLRARPPPGASPTEAFFSLSEVVAKAAVFASLLDACALRGVSQAADDACCADALWEQLYARRWGVAERRPPRPAGAGLWKQAFFAQLQRAQASFLAKLPALVQKARRKDHQVDTRKIHDGLKLRYSITVGPPGNSKAMFGRGSKTMRLSQESTQVFATSVCLRCSFSATKMHLPILVELSARSSALGTDRIPFSVSMRDLRAGGTSLTSDEHFEYLRSPCGRVLLAVWKTDGTVAGLFATLHHLHVLEPFLPDSVRQTLAGKPEYDDIDSRLGLHSYNMLLTLRSAKIESFSNCFYKVDIFKDQAFGTVDVKRACVVQRGELEKRLADSSDYAAEVAHFEVLAPHASGSRPPFPCLRPPQIAFQTSAFSSVLHDALFVDATVFDEHGRIFWAASAAVGLQSDAPPHESQFAAMRFNELDFDREDRVEGGGAAVRWICLAERGAAQLMVQLEYGEEPEAATEGIRHPPRLNSVTWHPELGFLDTWWGSAYSKRHK